MKKTHKQKLKIARKLLSRKEITNHTPPFNSDGWNKRKNAIAERIKRKLTKHRI